MPSLKRTPDQVTCYRPSIISVTVTKRGHPSSNRLYRTSGTIKRGVAKSRRSLVRKNIEI